MPPEAVFETRLSGLQRIHQGKVRDIYALDARHMLMVATDRLSAFDVVLPDPIPGKGRLLTQLSNFWFERTRHIVANHLTGLHPSQWIGNADELAMLEGRAVVVQRLQALPVEAVVRGYLIGSGWKDYQASGRVCGLALPAGLRLADRLPTPLFTPATKAAAGEHDENIGFEQVTALIGVDTARRIRELSLALYAYAAAHALDRGIIIADTKFEFGLDESGQVLLMDEVLTPDSSRFWPTDTWTPGSNPPSFDKQYVRDYLDTLDWNKQAPGPRLPAAVIQGTADKYAEAVRRLTS